MEHTHSLSSLNSDESRCQSVLSHGLQETLKQPPGVHSSREQNYRQNSSFTSINLPELHHSPHRTNKCTHAHVIAVIIHSVIHESSQKLFKSSSQVSLSNATINTRASCNDVKPKAWGWGWAVLDELLLLTVLWILPSPFPQWTGVKYGI